MIINHNMNALNAHRNMTANTNAAGKSMEKLSSGLRINRAGDDAAGLAISEKMRGQINGLEQASRNASDGISLIQTAEGALNETHNILQRVRELSVQGANDTNTAEDRTAIAEEINQLTEEIDRISQTTEFNGQNLLNGGFSGKFQIGANSSQTIGLEISGMGSNDLGLNGGTKLPKSVKVEALADGTASLKDGTYTVNGTNVLDSKGNAVATIATDGKVTANGKVTDLGHKLTDGSTIEIKNGKAEMTLAAPAAADAKLAAGEYKVSGTNLLNGDKLVGKVDGLEIKDANNKVIANMANYGFVAGDLDDTKTFTITGIDVSTADKASASITTLDAAINKVSEQRSKLGAVQNRLEHTTANLDNTAENLTSAESRIRDVDMAKEMMEFSKNNILQQAAQSMISQANQQPQNVLSLLR